MYLPEPITLDQNPKKIQNNEKENRKKMKLKGGGQGVAVQMSVCLA
jgi:hypothetical protein